MSIEVRTQSELDAALAKAKPGEIISIVGDGYFSLTDTGSATVEAGDSATVEAGGSATVRAWGSATVEAWGSATVEAWGSATVRAWGSATVRAWGSATVRAWGSATVRAGDSATVRAWGSATVRAGGSATVRAGDSATVEAWGSATVRAGGSATVRATPWVAVHRASKHAHITGGVIIDPPVLDNARTWCEYHGVPSGDDDIVVLFKAVDDNWHSSYKTPAGDHISYAPGEMPAAPDWDGGKEECGGGLHLSPTVHQARRFNEAATKYVGCPVRLADIAVHPDGVYPNKVKVPAVAGPCFEVDADGERVTTSEATA